MCPLPPLSLVTAETGGWVLGSRLWMSTVRASDDVLDDLPLREPGCEIVVARGYVTVDDADAPAFRHRLRQLLDGIPSAVAPVALDQLTLCRPRANPNAQRHPLFRRLFYVPSELSRSASRGFCVSKVPDNVVWASQWSVLVVAALQVTSVQPTATVRTQFAATVAGAAILLLSSLPFLISVRGGLLVRNVLQSFDFWFLVANVLGCHVCSAVGGHNISPAWIDYVCTAVHFFASVVGFLVLDAVPVTPAVKAMRYCLLTLLNLVDMISWMFVHAARDQTLDVGLYQTTLGAAAISFHGTVIAFLLRLAISANVSTPLVPLPPGRAIGLSG